MGKISKLINKTKRLSSFIGKAGTTWLMLGISSAFLMGLVEYGVAGFIQVLMVNIGIMDIDKLPAFAKPLGQMNIAFICLLLIIVGIAKAAGQFFAKQSSATFNNIINTRLRLITLYEILIGRNDKFIPASEIHLRFSEIFPKAGGFVSSITNCLVASAQILFMLGGMFFLAWKETAIGLFGLILIGTIVKIFQKKILKDAEGVVFEQEQIMRGIERITRNWLFVRISRTQTYEYNKAINQILRYFNHLSRSGFFSKFSANLPPLLGTILLAYIIYLSQVYFHTKETKLLAFLYLFIRFVQQISGLVDSIGGLITYFPQFKKAFALFESFSIEEMEKALIPSSGMFLVREKRCQFKSITENSKTEQVSNLLKIPEIIINNLSFSWDEDHPLIFKDFNLHVEKGSTLGISGHSGCGKSTLLLLILGIIHPKSGQVKVNGLNAQDFLKKFGHTIGYVGADPFIIHGTIRENLLYGNIHNNIDDAELWKALKKARLDTAIQGMNKKLDYNLSENGDGLSSGQKQRLSIARALLKEPRLLVLDEASANLDNATEEEIAFTLKDISKDCTMVIVSHRAGLLKYVDNEIKLDDLKQNR